MLVMGAQQLVMRARELVMDTREVCNAHTRACNGRARACNGCARARARAYNGGVCALVIGASALLDSARACYTMTEARTQARTLVAWVMYLFALPQPKHSEPKWIASGDQGIKRNCYGTCLKGIGQRSIDYFFYRERRLDAEERHPFVVILRPRAGPKRA